MLQDIVLMMELQPPYEMITLEYKKNDERQKSLNKDHFMLV